MDKKNILEKLGCVHLYCGDGKGKTTAAIGLAVRAAGRGIPVVFTQFMKDGSSGEIRVLESIDGIRVKYVSQNFGFFIGEDSPQRAVSAAAYQELFRKTAEECESGMLLVLDELCDACKYGLLDRQAVMDFLEHRPSGTEIVITGHDTWTELCEAADYYTVMSKEKHPFDRGLRARAGIEL